MTHWSLVTENVEETMRLGEMLGGLLQPGDFIALAGDLGAGKTHLAKGIAKGLEVEDSASVTSPTYTLMNVHRGRHTLYHFDLYRLSGDEDVIHLGFAEYFYGSGVSLVEWADRLHEELPEERLAIELSHEGAERRRISVEARGERYRLLLAALSRMDLKF